MGDLWVTIPWPRNMVQSYDATNGPFDCGDAVQIRDGIVHAGETRWWFGFVHSYGPKYLRKPHLWKVYNPIGITSYTMLYLINGQNCRSGLICRNGWFTTAIVCHSSRDDPWNDHVRWHHRMVVFRLEESTHLYSTSWPTFQVSDRIWRRVVVYQKNRGQND